MGLKLIALSPLLKVSVKSHFLRFDPVSLLGVKGGQWSGVRIKTVEFMQISHKLAD